MDWLQSSLSIDPATIMKVLLTAAFLIGLWLIRRWGLSLLSRRINEPKTIYSAERVSIYLAYIISAVIIVGIWIDSTRQIGTYLGLLSAGLAIALKDPITSLIGWAYILWRKPFSIGDRVEIGNHIGDVIDINLFQFSLMEVGNWVKADQSTGRIIHLPNSLTLIQPLANYTEQFDYIWNEIPVLLTFESNWQEAKQILQVIAEQHSPPSEEIQAQLEKPQVARRYYFFYTHLTPVIYTSVDASGVCLTIRYPCAVRERRSSTQAIWEDVLQAFSAAPDIQLAYPTRRQIVDFNQKTPTETES